MATNRLEILQGLLERNPKDSFARYGLAMEYKNSGNADRAIAEFRTVIENDPNYSYAYFHGGQTLEKAGRIEEARALYERGIEVTKTNGDQHALSELQGALELLPL